MQKPHDLFGLSLSLRNGEGDVAVCDTVEIVGEGRKVPYAEDISASVKINLSSFFLLPFFATKSKFRFENRCAAVQLRRREADGQWFVHESLTRDDF